MATQLQIRRGTASQIAAFTGAEGEVVVNTTNDSIVVNDGSTAGGFEMARADLNNVSDTSLNAALTGNTVSALTVTALTTGSITTTGDISFGDNDKAIFGGGSDLQIYHDGTHSNIKESGAGDLQIFGDNVNIYNAAGSQNLINLTSGGANTLFHNGSAKLATTSTGIDVTGGVTTNANSYLNGLRVGGADTGNTIYQPTGDLSISSASGSIFLKPSGTSVLTATSTGIAVTGNAYVGAGNYFTDSTSGYFFGGSGSFTNGVYGVGTNNMAFNVAGSERMRIDSSGNVGINNSSPSAYGKFVVDGTGNILNVNATSGSALLQLYEGGSGRFGIQTLDGSAGAKFTTAGTERMRIDSSGNLLVGTTNNSPVGNNVVGIGLFANGSAQLSRNDGTVLLLNRKGNHGTIADFRKDGLTVGSIGTNSGFFYVGGTSGNDAFLSFGADGVRPSTSTGAARDAAIDLGGSTNRFKDLYLSGIANIGTYLRFGGASNYYVHSDNANYLRFGTAGSERMRIDSSGNVGIGISNPSDYFSSWDDLVVGDTSGHAGMSIVTGTSHEGTIAFADGTSGTAPYRGFLQYNHSVDRLVIGTAGTERMRIDSSGNLLVGTTTTGSGAQSGVAIAGGASSSDIYIRHANGTSSGAVYASFIYNTSQIGRISQNGTSQVLYQVSSDQRLKLNISDADDSSAIIDAIRVRKFDWKSDGEHQRYGMIAQELQNVAPEAVGDVSDPDEMLGVDYSKLVPMLVKEIQSLRARVAQLEN